MAIAAGVEPLVGENGRPDGNTIVPLLFDQQFPDWFAGVAFAAIGIGALVPATIMSIAAANLWTRSICQEYINPNATPKQGDKSSKLASLVVKVGALALDPQFSIDLQLIGGVIMLQTLPAVALGLYTRWFHSKRSSPDGPPAWRWASRRCTRSRSACSVPTARSPSPRSTSACRASRWPGSGWTRRRRSTRARWPSPPTCWWQSSPRWFARAGQGRADTTRPADYTDEAGDPGVKDLTEIVH